MEIRKKILDVPLTSILAPLFGSMKTWLTTRPEHQKKLLRKITRADPASLYHPTLSLSDPLAVSPL